MNRVVLPMNGGVNKDTNPLYIDSEKGEVLDRRNARVFSADGERVGINVSIKGMLEVESNLPAGDNKVIGYIEDIEREGGVFFNWNSNGDDNIYYFDGTAVISLGVDSGVLSLDEDNYIEAAMLGDYCVFTDNVNPPRKIKITNDDGDVASGLLTGKTGVQIELAVEHPTDAPTIAIGSDTTKKVNKLVGKTFQFAYYYVYDDNTYSVFSPYSELLVSSSVFNAADNTYTNNATGNFASVSFDLGGDGIKEVTVVAREGNTGDWFIVEEHEKVSSGERTIVFYNDVAREYIARDKALSLYSDVPLRAKTTVAVQNRIGLANITKGYDKEVNFDYETEIEYEDVTVSGTTGTFPDSDGTDVDSYYIEWDMPDADVGSNVIINLSGVVEDQDGSGIPQKQFKILYSWSHVVTADDVNTGDVPNRLAGLLAQDITDNEDSIIAHVYVDDDPAYPVDNIGIQGSNEGGGDARMYFVGAHNPTLTNSSAYISTNSYETAPSGVNTYKSGSYYQVGGVFMDDKSRTSGVVKNQQIYVPHNGEREYSDAYDKARIKFALNGYDVPSWATRFKWAVTESVNFAGVYPFVTGNTDGGNAYETFLDGKEVLAILLPENFQYEFVNGDYFQIEVDDGTEITKTIVKTIIGTRTLIEIDDEEKAGYWLIVPRGDETVTTYQDNLAYIYRTKDEVSTLIYYETSITYDIVDGEIKDTDGTALTEGYIGDGDTWFVSRKFDYDNDGTGSVTTTTEVVEDFYLSVDAAIRAYSKGRALVEFDTLGQITLQDFVWSESYLDNTKINGISFFDASSRIQLDEKDGEIQSMKLVGFVLKAIQDNKETSMYIGKQEVSNSDGSLNLVQTNNFIGTVRPSDTDFGSRWQKSIVKYNRNTYYFDSDHGEVVRSSPNGQYAISEYGMKSEFLRIKRDIDNALLDNETVKVVAFYDVRNDEYVITFDIAGVAETLAFREGADAWVGNYDYTDGNNTPPTMYGNIGELGIGFLNNTWKMERGTAHNTFFGSFKPLSLIAAINTPKIKEKCIRALEMDSNRGLDTVITTPITNTAIVGQKTILYPQTYRERRGAFTSPVNRNIRMADGSDDISLLFTGDDMVGRYVKFEFTDNESSECQLRSVTVSYTVNM